MLKTWVNGIAGAIAGGCFGFFAFGWLVTQGYYGMVIPAAFTGLGCGLATRRRCRGLGVFCVVLGAAVSLYAEWKHFPFKADRSLGYFLSHVHELTPTTYLLIAIGLVMAFVLGQGNQATRSKAE